MIFADPLSPLYVPLGVRGPPVKNLWSRGYLNLTFVKNTTRLINFWSFLTQCQNVVLDMYQNISAVFGELAAEEEVHEVDLSDDVDQVE